MLYIQRNNNALCLVFNHAFFIKKKKKKAELSLHTHRKYTEKIKYAHNTENKYAHNTENKYVHNTENKYVHNTSVWRENMLCSQRVMLLGLPRS